ncbi:MAG: SpoIIE family protein phosphatase [Aeromicrobium sp.]|uniref:PP2C family protein-serine/threonine phosphatase n=1 Tax=Aeromicrobium sp. TaxID=1871063 RepID=UPI003C47E224
MTPAGVEDFFARAPCGYLALGADGVITAANQKFLDLVGRPADQVVGHATFPTFLGVGDRMYHETHFRPLLQMHGEVHEIAFDVVRADGASVPVLVSANVRAEDGSVRAIVFEARDRRTYEKELLVARAEAVASESKARDLAETLQKTFIPAAPPQIPGLHIEGAYRPAGDGTEVGGDFYDVFQVRTGEWVLVIGDVEGKGMHAATVTAFVRHSIRAIAMQVDSPAEILQAVNLALALDGRNRFCTVAAVRLSWQGDHWSGALAVGGHPLPLLKSSDGMVTEMGVPGSLLGVLDVPHLVDATFVLGEDESIVLFTDGVIDAQASRDHYGEDRLTRLVETSDSATDMADEILQDVMQFQGGQARDDIAVLVATGASTAPPPGGPEGHHPGDRHHRISLEDKNRRLLALAERPGDEDE